MILLRGFKRALTELKALLLTFGLLLIAGTAIGQPFIVPSGSMEPTLLVGDEIAASKFSYGYGKFSSPIGLMPNFNGRIFERAAERGDIAVFALPRDPSRIFVKRVIGLPGDRIQMKGGRLHINGEAVSRQAVAHVTIRPGGRDARLTKYIETLPSGRKHEIVKRSDRGPLDDTPELVVPPDSYFMLGDNRDNSLDSRVPPELGGVGFVPAENLIGRVDRVLFSISPFANWREAIGALGALRISRVLQAVE